MRLFVNFSAGTIFCASLSIKQENFSDNNKQELILTHLLCRREEMFLRKPYETVEEFYKEVEQLVQALRTNGNAEEASRLDVLLHGVWTTGSELIGELMLSLYEMKGSFPGDIRKQINDCHYFAKHHRRILGLH